MVQMVAKQTPTNFKISHDVCSTCFLAAETGAYCLASTYAGLAVPSPEGGGCLFLKEFSEAVSNPSLHK